MISDLPMTDWVAMARWLGAFAAIVLLPGWLLVGWHVRDLDWLSRLALSAGAGFLATTLLALGLSALGLPMTPATCLGIGLLLSFGLGRLGHWRQAARGLADGIGRMAWSESLIVLALCAGQAFVLLAAFRDYAAPNSIDDASNHAFMVARALAAQSLSPDKIFAPPNGLPAIPYLPGWHGCAALIAGLGHVPPWVSAWYLPALVAVATPLALSLFWRAAKLPRPALLLGLAFAVANYHQPLNIFSWGGFGAIIGLALAPWIVLALRGAMRTPSVASGLLAGAAMVAILYIHTSEAFTALVLLAAVWPDAGERSGSRHDFARALVWACAFFLVVGIIPLWQHARVYGGWTASEALPPRLGLVPSLAQFLTFAGGNMPGLHWFVAPGLLAGFLSRRTRRLAWLSLAFLLLYLGLRCAQDPVSSMLSRPYYRQFPRVVYPQMFLLPPLMATAALGILAGLGRLWRWRGRRILTTAAVAALAYFVLYPGAYWSYRNLAFQRTLVPFSPAEAQLAREMARVLPSDAVVANQYGDGSYWAMHISRLRFLDPCAWPLGLKQGLHHRPAIEHLLERPWPAAVLALRDLGTAYVFVSDTVQQGVHPALTRQGLGADSRFSAVLDNGSAAVYRIEWDME